MIGIDTSTLNKASVSMHRSTNGVQNAVGRLLNSGNASKSLLDGGDTGGLSMVSRLGAENRSKSQLAKSMQNAVTYIQMQEAGLRKALAIYERMSQLANMASDQFTDESVRADLNFEFQALKQDSFSLRSETFMGSYLYDDMAAKYFPEIDFGKGFTDKTTNDSEVEVGTLSPFYSGWNASNSKYYELEKEVHFNSGKFALEVNGGGSGERYILKQGNNILFDTAGGNSTDYKWKTEGTAYDYDFDRFEIEYAPGKATTFKFVPLTPGNATKVAGSDNTVGTGDDPPNTWSGDTRYDNKDSYISQLGLGSSSDSAAEESTPWLSGDDRTDHLFSGVAGEIGTNPASADTTKLTLRVEADTIFQINAVYSPLEEATNNKKVVGYHGNVSLEAVGIGITLVDSSLNSRESSREALDFLTKEIENISLQLATLGANMSELEVAEERLNNQVFLSEAGISRLTSDVLVDESTRLAKEQIRLQSSQALLAQAFSLSENILNTLL